MTRQSANAMTYHFISLEERGYLDGTIVVKPEFPAGTEDVEPFWEGAPLAALSSAPVLTSTRTHRGWQWIARTTRPLITWQSQVLPFAPLGGRSGAG